MSEQRSIELRLKANISDFKSQIDSAADAAAGFGKAIEASSRKVEQARDRQRDAAQQVAAAEKRLAQVRASDASASKIATAEKEVARAKNLNKAATTQLAAAEAAHAKVSQQASTTMGQLAQSVSNNADIWHGYSSALTRTGLVLGAVVVAAGVKMAQFETAMSQVSATGSDARGSLDQLRETALRVGADTAFSATEAAQGIENLLKAGVSARDVIGGGLVGTMNLAAAGSLAVADAAEIAATALTVFGLKGSDMAHVADLLAAGAGKAQGEVSDLAVALKYIGPVASGMGISIEETVGALSAFASQGILADQAGTSLRGVLMSMTSPSSAARKEMARLGISLYDGTGKFRGLSNVAGQLSDAYAGVSDRTKDASLGIIFGNAQVTAARVLFAQGAEGIEEWVKQVNDAGYAARAAATMMDNLSGDVEKLGGAIDTALIKGGGGLNQAARGLVQDATRVVDAFGSMPAPILESGARLTAFTAISALAAGGALKLGINLYEGYQNFKVLDREGSKVTGTLRKFGKAAAVAGVALAAIEIGRIFGSMRQAEIDKTKASLADVAEALAKVASEAQSAQGLKQLNEQFQAIDSVADGVGQAILIMGATSRDGFMNGAAGMAEWAAGLVGMDAGLKPLREQMEKVDEQLSQMDGAQAAAAFRVIAADAERVGAPLEYVTDLLPQYKARLQEIATQMGANVSPQEYVEWMGGKVPDAVKAASAAHPELIDKLSDTQKAALDGAQSLDDYIKALFDAANAALAVSGSQVGFEQTMNNTTTSVKKLVAEAKKAGDLKNLTNIGTAEGQKAIEILNKLSTSTIAYTSSMIKNGASQEETRLVVARARADFISSAKAMGYSATEARKLADARGLIPKNISMNVTDEGTAQAKARTDALKDSIKGLPKSAQTKILSEFQKGGIDDAYAALRKIDKKKAEAFIKSILDRGGINDWNSYKPKSKTAYVDTVYRTKSGQQYRASGGSVFGPGSETSDSIPAMLSNNEHVWSAREVRGAGGHGAMERLRAMAREGRMPAFRDGGPVVWSALAGGDVQYFAKGGAAKKAAAKAKREALEELARELGVDVRRGNITDDVLGGSGLSRIDQLLDWSRDTNLSKSSRDMLAKKAAGFEKQLTGLQTKLTDAEKQADSLGQTYDQVKSALGSFDLAGALESGRTQSFDAATGRAVWSDATASSIAAQATKRAATLKTFSDKIAALVKAGASGSVVQEIVALGSEQGIKVADMFLSNPDALKQMNQAYADIDKWSGQAAQNTTEAFAKGGKAAADALVKSLQDQMSKLGEEMAAALAAALGLKIDDGKLKKKAAGGPVSAGQLYQVNELGPELFRPAVNGYMLTAAQTAQQMQGGTVYNLSVNGARVGMDPRLESAVRTIVEVVADGPSMIRAGF